MFGVKGNREQATQKCPNNCGDCYTIGLSRTASWETRVAVVGELVTAEFKKLDTTLELEANAVVSINKVPKSKKLNICLRKAGGCAGSLNVGIKAYCQRCRVRPKVVYYWRQRQMRREADTVLEESV